MNVELQKQVEDRWHKRAAALGYKPGTKTYAKMECEFFAGAMVAINALCPHPNPDLLSDQIPAYWVVAGMTGRPIATNKE